MRNKTTHRVSRFMVFFLLFATLAVQAQEVFACLMDDVVQSHCCCEADMNNKMVNSQPNVSMTDCCEELTLPSGFALDDETANSQVTPDQFVIYWATSYINVLFGTESNTQPSPLHNWQAFALTPPAYFTSQRFRI